jgi:hypothetical protein
VCTVRTHFKRITTDTTTVDTTNWQASLCYTLTADGLLRGLRIRGGAAGVAQIELSLMFSTTREHCTIDMLRTVAAQMVRQCLATHFARTYARNTGMREASSQMRMQAMAQVSEWSDDDVMETHNRLPDGCRLSRFELSTFMHPVSALRHVVWTFYA